MALFEHENECVFSYTICVVYVVIALTINIRIAAYFTCKYMNRNRKLLLRKVWTIKKEFIELTNGKYQRNKH